MSFASARAFCWGVAVCFSLGGLYRFGQLFGTLEWLVNYKRRGRFKRSLDALLGTSLSRRERGRACRRHFARSRCDKIFYLIFDKIPPADARARFQIVHRELLDDALARNNGCFVAMSHHGAHHISALLLARYGYRTALVRDRNEGAIRRFVQDRFDQKGSELQHIRVLFADAYPRDIYRCFRENFALGAALDAHRYRGASKRTTAVQIFGGQREYIDGTVRIALRCGAGVIQGFVISLPGFRYRFELIDLGAEVPGNGAPNGSIESIMQTYADNVERYVRKYPCHVSKA
ncbi:MAG: hypothetical protein GY778_16200 [bacterium]|nr:hypothetical protein [bacterium]